MSKKNVIISIIFLGLVTLAGVIFYSYAKLPASVNSNSNVNQNDSPLAITSGPVIEVTPASYDLGTVVYGKIAEHTFTVKNLGDKPLEILRLSTSCGCTKATMAEKDKIIAPGQSAEMLVTFDPAVHQNDMDLGELTRIVYIRTNDPKKPETEVEIKAKVIKEETTAQTEGN